MYACMYVRTYVRTYVCMYICIYIYICENPSDSTALCACNLVLKLPKQSAKKHSVPQDPAFRSECPLLRLHSTPLHNPEAGLFKAHSEPRVCHSKQQHRASRANQGLCPANWAAVKKCNSCRKHNCSDTFATCCLSRRFTLNPTQQRHQDLPAHSQMGK